MRIHRTCWLKLRQWVTGAARQLAKLAHLDLTPAMTAALGQYEKLETWFAGTWVNGRAIPRLWSIPFALLLYFLVLGPSPRMQRLTDLSAPVNLLLSLALVLVAAWLVDLRVKSSRRLFWDQFSLTAVGLLFFLGAGAWQVCSTDRPPPWREAAHIFFPHLWFPLTFLMFLIAAGARPLARRLLCGVRRKLTEEPLDVRAILARASSPNHEQAPRTPATHWTSFFKPFGLPVELLFPAAAWLVFIDDSFLPVGPRLFPWLYHGGAFLLLVIAFVCLMQAEHDPRLGRIRSAARRVFWYGGLWGTTVGVVGLALAWLADFGYVKTVLEGSRGVVVAYVLAGYALFWTYEYWVNRTLTEEVLDFFGPRRQEDSYVELERQPPATGNVVLSIHGAAQLSVFCRAEGAGRAAARSAGTFDRSSLFTDLLAEEPPLRSPWGQKAIQELRGRMRMYFTLLNTLALLVAGTLFWTCVHRPRVAIVQAETVVAGGQKDLCDLLLRERLEEPTGAESESAPRAANQAGTPPRRPRVILLAASGGGTRAALYTSSALEGLWRQGALADVRLVSGVSGGGVALAYFAVHRQVLCATKAAAAWDQFHEAMAFAYITEVLRGASECRVLWNSSISALLSESFQRQFWPAVPQAANGSLLPREVTQLGHSPLGLIFNTTLVGESPPRYGINRVLSADEIRRSNFASGWDAGARLIFTNLSCRDAFRREGSPRAPTEFLRYIVVDDPAVELTAAAALNANFPPVFPNAPVDVKAENGLHRYWVTDGGAEENKGEISLLYALGKAIRDQSRRREARLLPDIFVVVLEASAGSYRFSQDQGLSGVGGAAAKLANQLALELEDDVEEGYRQLHAGSLPGQVFQDRDGVRPPRLEVHFLPMPTVLRIDRGVGTHWMLPDTVLVQPPTVAGLAPVAGVALSRDQVRRLIRELHGWRDPAADRHDPDLRTAWSWIKNDFLPPGHPHAWGRVCCALGHK